MFYLIGGLVVIFGLLLCGGLTRVSKDQDDATDKLEYIINGGKGA